MTINKLSPSRVTVTEVQEFLANPPAGFSVEALSSGYRVHCDPEDSLVLVDDFYSCRGKIAFHNSLGRKVKMQNLWEYTSRRKSLLSKRIYLLVSACQGNLSVSSRKAASEARGPASVLQQYVVSIDSSDPFIKWQMEKGLDWTISSVAGESYRVDIDLTELLESWVANNSHILADRQIQVKPVWRDASFTLKYYSDALFDFPHWFGFSKRTFKLRLTRGSSG
ncbi:mesenteric estrogen-dependent adipogenesis protein [Pempheris klunzingeri]|uniref:mesenteric estrogen-dependent adipogenesis protein n=1 Tax=Pempheris klunzingeri TaxID=3127111 RepID=UPI003980EB73